MMIFLRTQGPQMFMGTDMRTKGHSTSPFEVVIAESEADLERRREEWEELAGDAIEPNVFYEPWIFIPAWRAFPRPKRAAVAFVYGEGKKLCGVFPIVRGRHHRFVPCPRVSLFRYYFCSLCTPLVRSSCAPETIRAFMCWFAVQPESRGYLDFSFINGSGPFHSALQSVLADARGIATRSDGITRAFFVPRATSEEYLAHAFRGKKRKEMRRLERRLSEFGALAYEPLLPDGSIESWINEFLDLEQSGWKGREGSAFGMAPEAREFFHASITDAFKRGRLRAHAMTLDGKMIAAVCGFTAQDGAYAFRIAVNERYAQFSLGTLLLMRDVQHLHEEKIGWLDSCAGREHFLADHIWFERRPIVNIKISGALSAGRLLFAAESGKDTVKRWLARRSAEAATPPSHPEHS